MSKKGGKNIFKDAVDQTRNLNFQNGLRALGMHSNKINLNDPVECEGSIDIDADMCKQYPQSNRWDYGFSYKGEIFFVEVHSAKTSEVDVVIKKLAWLKDWLNSHAPAVNRLKAQSRTPFYWIQSNGFHILPTSSQYRAAIQKNIKPVSKLVLP